ncbi:Lipid droplet-associated hydrolase [Parasponia andersonii]|uniref:Lipid droplet-associated hydrolase n=1 Tax=Parasponia andersonii TaxID=3476 RepID=A0A2P5D9X1_PARAD|nr:Lipid droplet-associated hydrolase [Parasponia andersonii]
MLLRIAPSFAKPIGLSVHFSHFRSKNRSYGVISQMSHQVLRPKSKKLARFRLCNVSSYATELLEVLADEPTFHVLVIPGNPGVVPYYKEFVESLYELLGGSASVTAVGHLSHTKKDWEHGRLFSLQEQIDHKVHFIKQELQNDEVPILLAGHSIGAYICIEMFKRIPEKVLYCVGLYPFLALNLQSRNQSIIGKIAASPVVCVALSTIVALLGLLPIQALRLIVSQSLGKSWSSAAVEATCSHLAKYHTMRNMLYMAMTEFRKLSETPDWAFMREKHHRIAFLFGTDDHWGPLQMFEEISRQVPDIAISREREGHTHAFCCTEAGSTWVAQHVATLINNQISRSTQ